MSLSRDLQSMTGFARASASFETDSGETVQLRCEIRSVNGKGLDVRTRFPDGLETVEQNAKKYAAQCLSRGNLQMSLVVETDAGKSSTRIDEALFAKLATQAKEIATNSGLQPPSADAILAMRGVVLVDENEAIGSSDEALVQHAADICREALNSLVDNRRNEGTVIGRLLADQVNEIERLTAACAGDPALDSAQALVTLKAQLDRLLKADEGKTLDPDRLHAEAALLATKSDIREELDRLTAHIAAARDLLAQGGTIGRKLDFLCQEFNRETNTLCAKSSTSSLTATGLAMKAIVDQMKEQAANIQ